MGIRRPAPDTSTYYEDDEDEITPVVRRARPQDDEDDNPAPARSVQRRRATQEAAEEEAPKMRVPRQRTQTEDDFEEEDPEVQAPASSRVAAGWGAAKSLQSEGSDYTSEFKLSEEPVLIKFLADEPFAVYRQHFLREKEGKKSYICLGSGCPLCDDLGDTPDKKFAFTMADLSQETFGGGMLVTGPRLLGVLEKANNGKYGPLSRHYWEISRTGTGRKTDYVLSVVRDRDLKDDYGLDSETINGVLRKIKLFDSSAIKESTKAELREIVAELDS